MPSHAVTCRHRFEEERTELEHQLSPWLGKGVQLGVVMTAHGLRILPEPSDPPPRFPRSFVLMIALGVTCRLTRRASLARAPLLLFCGWWALALCGLLGFGSILDLGVSFSWSLYQVTRPDVTV